MDRKVRSRGKSMKFQKTAKLAVTAGLCLSMAFGGAPITAFATAVDAPKADKSADKMVYVEYDGMSFAISDHDGNIDMNLVNSDQQNIQARVDEKFGAGKKEASIAYDAETGKWNVVVSDIKVDEDTHTNVYYCDPMGGYTWNQTVVNGQGWYYDLNGIVSHEGYTFAGWSIDAQGGEILDPSEPLTLIGDVTLYAQWKAGSTSGDGSGEDNMGVDAEGKLNVFFRDALDDDYLWEWAGAPQDGWYFNPQETGAIVHEGYEFAGWTYDKEGKQPVAEDAFASTTGDVTVYAQWKQVEQGSHLNVIYRDAMDDSYSWTWTGAPQDGWYFNPEANGTLSHEGYTFAGWTYDKEGKQPVAEDALLTTTGDVTLYAQWKASSTSGDGSGEDNMGVEQVHKVTFVDGYNNVSNTVEVKDGETVAKPEDPTYSGAKFHGWSTDSEKFVAYDFATPVTEDMTLTAFYTPVKGEDEETAKPEAKKDESALPQTGDASTIAIAGAAVAGAAILAAGVASKRRQN